MMFLPPVILPFSSTCSGVSRVVRAYLGDLDLHGGVVLGSDESVGGRALAGNVEINNFSFVVFHD